MPGFAPRRSQTPESGQPSGGFASPRVVILSRVGCHLCDVAEQVVEETLASLPTPVDYTVVDIDTWPEAERRPVTDLVPVIQVDGRTIATYRISPERLRAALR